MIRTTGNMPHYVLATLQLEIFGVVTVEELLNTLNLLTTTCKKAHPDVEVQGSILLDSLSLRDEE